MLGAAARAGYCGRSLPEAYVWRPQVLPYEIMRGVSSCRGRLGCAKNTVYANQSASNVVPPGADRCAAEGGHCGHGGRTLRPTSHANIRIAAASPPLRRRGKNASHPMSSRDGALARRVSYASKCRAAGCHNLYRSNRRPGLARMYLRVDFRCASLRISVS